MICQTEVLLFARFSCPLACQYCRVAQALSLGPDMDDNGQNEDEEKRRDVRLLLLLAQPS